MNNSIGASDLKRLELCPGSLNACKNCGETNSEIADRGTDLHVLFERAVSDLGTQNIPAEYKDEVEKIIDVLVDNFSSCKHDDPMWELPVDLTFLGCSAGRGRIDLLIINPINKEAIIIDLKTGAIIVDSPKYNRQLQAYACGVARQFPDIETFNLCILQPSAYEPFKVWGYTRESIKALEPELKAIIDNAQKPDAPIIPSEKACMFCNAKLTCPAYVRALRLIPNNEISFEEHITALSPAELGEFYEKTLLASTLAGKWKKEIESRVISGHLSISGYKVEQGEGNRQWKDNVDDELIAIVESVKKDTNDLYTKPELISPAQFEKLVGKKKEIKEKIDALTERKAGAYKLVKEFELCLFLQY